MVQGGIVQFIPREIDLRSIDQLNSYVGKLNSEL